MVKKIDKIRIHSCDDDELVDKCKKEIDCGDCEPITWTTPSKATQIDPPKNTAAVIVDVVDKKGAIRIFEKESGEYVNGVGIEEAGNLVIVPWDINWWFRMSGSLRVGYIIAKDAA